VPAGKLCLDWTERRHHISGSLATALLRRSLEMKWLERRTGGRALTITPAGHEAFRDAFGLTSAEIEGTARETLRRSSNGSHTA